MAAICQTDLPLSRTERRPAESTRLICWAGTEADERTRGLFGVVIAAAATILATAGILFAAATDGDFDGLHKHLAYKHCNHRATR
jgi:hypothetical protein